MTQSISVYFADEEIGRIRVSEWGTVFDPIDQRAEFDQLRLLTWESPEMAQSEITKFLNRNLCD